MRTAKEQMREVRALMNRISDSPWNPGRQAEFDSARRLLNELRREARLEA